MRHFYLALLVCMLGSATALRAQLPDGALAPNWTLTDINGQSHNLYSYLNQGKTVFLDFFATWCGPCWNYHNSGALEGLYEQYGPGGTNEVMVIAIEADNNTTLADLYGTGSNTQGNWVAGTAYPIINSASLNSAYSIGYFPTIYAVCPNRAIYEVGQLPTAGLYAFVGECPSATPGFAEWDVTPVTCFGGNDGAIAIELSGGVVPVTYLWSNGATSPTISGLTAGNYRCTITDGLGQTAVSPFINVPQPTAALAIGTPDIEDEACDGSPGAITVAASGGWPDYQYLWSTGSTGETLDPAQDGTYSVTVTDDRGCTTSLGNIVVSPPDIPTAVALVSSQISCAIPTLQLSGFGSSEGSNISYLWSTQNGQILSGSTTLSPTVGAAGTYILTVTNNTSGCSETAEAVVLGNTTPPSAAAQITGGLNCALDTVFMVATTPNMTYAWSTTNGTIIGSTDTAAIVITAIGSYVLQVTNTANGCVGQATYTVAFDTLPPVLSPVATSITCAVATPLLNSGLTDTLAQYLWTGPEDFSSALIQPAVSIPGIYTVVVTGANGCTNTDSLEVSVNVSIPNLEASGGTLTCANTTVELSASSTTEGTLIIWNNTEGDTLSSPVVTSVGDYTALATGPNGCTNSLVVSVGSDTTLPEAAAGADVTLPCNNDQVQLAATVGNPEQTSLQWATVESGNILSGENTATPLVQGTGTYVLTASSLGNGCALTDTVVVTQPVALAVAVAVDSVSCFGTADGAATASVANGQAPYEFLWSTGATTESVANLPAGTYSLTVSDNGECVAVSSVVINQPDNLQLSLTATAQSSFEANDGSVTASTGGGIAPYSYAWSNGADTPAIEGLAPGTYTLTLTDANGCTQISTATVNSFNCTVAATANVTNVSCFGNADGSIQINFTGGTEPFSVAWADEQTGELRTGLAAGVYEAVVTDGNGCPLALLLTVEQPADLLANASASAESSYQANDGVITASPAGGTAPYTYIWSTGDTTQQVQNLSPGEYALTITDNNGCTVSSTLTVDPFVCLFSLTSETADINCFGDASGEINLIPLAGVGPYTYNWNNGATGSSLSELTAGDYQVTATDGKNCPAVLSMTLLQPEQLVSVIAEQSNVFCADEATGSAQLALSGGVEPYAVSWSNGFSGNQVAGLTAGTYAYLVTDANGCETAGALVITANDDQAPVALAQDITVPLGVDGAAIINAAAVDAGSSDNCSIVLMDLDRKFFNCEDIGQQTVVLTVVDGAGNTSSVTATVTVVDNIAPVVDETPIQLQLDANGQATVDQASIAARVTDNCNDAQWTVNQTTFDCSQLGSSALIITAVDASGNQSVTTIPVNVTDEIAPVVSCPPSISVLNCTGVAEYELPTAVDNCAIAGELVQTAGLPSGSVFPAGITVNSFKFTDISGNTATCNIVVTVPQPTEVAVASSDVSCAGANDGSIALSVAGGVAPYTYTWSGGNNPSGAEQTGLTAGSYSVTVTDLRGCTSVVSIEIEQPAPIAVAVVEVQPDVNGALSGAIDIAVTGGVAPYQYSWIFNGNVVSTVQDPTNLAAGTYLLRLIDANGCATTLTVIVETVSGISTPDFAHGLLVYPNPTSSELRLVFSRPLEEPLTLQLYDMVGRQLTPTALVAKGSELFVVSVDNLPGGVYILQMRQGSRQWSSRISVVK